MLAIGDLLYVLDRRDRRDAQSAATTAPAPSGRCSPGSRDACASGSARLLGASRWSPSASTSWSRRARRRLVARRLGARVDGGAVGDFWSDIVAVVARCAARRRVRRRPHRGRRAAHARHGRRPHRLVRLPHRHRGDAAASGSPVCTPSLLLANLGAFLQGTTPVRARHLRRGPALRPAPRTGLRPDRRGRGRGGRRWVCWRSAAGTWPRSPLRHPGPPSGQNLGRIPGAATSWCATKTSRGRPP